MRVPEPASDPPASNELIEHLRTVGAYPHDPSEVEEIQTHISWVFIVPPLVYKVKKPVSLGFLDFSTLEQRRHYCQEELRLNRRLCPDVYEDVVPISKRKGSFKIGDASNVVEYAVRMRQLSGGAFADELQRDGRLGESDVDRIVETLARFYRQEAATAETAGWGRIGKLRISTDENFEQTQKYVGSLLPNTAHEAARFYTDRFYDQHARLLHRRRAAGFVRECHGDLHLEHVYLRPDGVCIYDCIEFSERLRSLDVANDVAFLAMDLDFNQRPHLASYFVDRMADALDDRDLPRLADFYKCYRAYVRAKVESMRSDEDEVPEDEREKSRERARRYYRLATRYGVAGSQPVVVIVMGRVGTGKSTVAKQVADAVGCRVAASDRIRKEQAGVPAHVRGTERERKELYTAARTEAVYQALEEEALQRAHADRGIVIDATYSRRSHRDALRQALLENDLSYCFIELTASDETLRGRLRTREAGSPHVSDARLEDFDMLNERYEAPDDLEDAFHVRVSADASETETVARSLKALVRFDFGYPPRRPQEP